MRTSFAVAAGLAAVATAADVTITSCSPTHTNCPYKPESGHWEDWEASTSSSTPVKVTSSSYDPSQTWADWSSASTTSSNPVKITSTSSSYDPSHTWADWESSSSSSAPAVSTSSSSYDSSYSWGDWSSVSTTSSSSSTPAVVTSTSACPMYTATAPPAWFSYLASDVKSSIAAKWTGAPPADWCYYTYSTSTPVASSTPAYSSPVSPASSTPAASSAVWSAYSA